MNFHPIVVTHAPDCECAWVDVEDFIDSVTGDGQDFDYGAIKRNADTPYNTRLTPDLLNTIPPVDHLSRAKEHLEKGHAQLAQSHTYEAGYNFERAGRLLQQRFCLDSLFFNLDSRDYTLPNLDEPLYNDHHWYVFELDMHF